MKPYQAYIKECMLITYKIDGVQAIRSETGWISRAGKSLYNLPDNDKFPVGCK